MDKNKLINDYASLLVEKGVSVEKGDEVWIYATVEQSDFVVNVVEKCYLAGAKKVVVNWDNDALTRLHYKHQTLSTLSKLPNYDLAKYKYMAKKLPSRLYIIAEDPDALKGLNVNKISKSKMKIYPKIKAYRDAIDGNHKWCIAGVPGKAWAHKVFPNLSIEEAMDKLWDAILLTSRVDENGAVNNWNKHNAFLDEQSKKLRQLDLQFLEYKSSNGTNFKVELIKNVIWGAGHEVESHGKTFNPNIPTEEVFATPVAGKCEGTLVASLPLSYQGQLIEDFSITFKNGKVSEVHARKGQTLLETMIKMDDGACMLGEVALVPFSSPINKSGILFFNTLYDENAVCHFALGAGYKDRLPNASKITTEEAKKMGVNDSMIHVDFMVGTKDLCITGTSFDGKKTVIFKDGEWAI